MIKVLQNNRNIERRIPLATWVADPNTWNKYSFIDEASKFMWEAYGNTAEQDQHALAMLAEILETFVICCKDITKNGLVITHHNGVTGKNHHVEIRDKAITKSVLLMNELGLTPKGRFPIKPTTSSKVQKFLQGPKGENVTT
jgi:phage terminase small subunit